MIKQNIYKKNHWNTCMHTLDMFEKYNKSRQFYHLKNKKSADYWYA